MLNTNMTWILLKTLLFLIFSFNILQYFLTFSNIFVIFWIFLPILHFLIFSSNILQYFFNIFQYFSNIFQCFSNILNILDNITWIFLQTLLLQTKMTNMKKPLLLLAFLSLSNFHISQYCHVIHVSVSLLSSLFF